MAAAVAAAPVQPPTTVGTGAADFYLAPDGNDQWSGTLPTANARRTDGPFATLERARDAIRQLRAKQAWTRPLVVQLRGGTYRRVAPWVLRPEDSGTEASPVVYTAGPGEQPVISGGRVLGGWQQEGSLWKTELPEVRRGSCYFRQLFVNGQRRARTRFPKEGVLTVAGLPPQNTGSWMGNLPEKKSEWDRRSFGFKPGDLRKDWRNLEDVEVVVLQFWMESRLRIKHLDEASRVAVFTGGSWRPLAWSWGYYVENVAEGLDKPGTWYLDRGQGTLRYHPLPGENPQQVEVTVPVAEQLVRLEGDAAAGRPVAHVVFRGLQFADTDWRLPAEGYMCIQAEITAPAAIHCDGASHCRFEHCTLARLGAWGVEFRRGCRDNAVVHSTLRDLGAGAIKIGEPENAARDVDETRGTVVADNRILDCGHVYLGSVGVWIGQSSGNAVRHNEISGPLMWAVSAGWTWSYFPLQRARDNVIEFNHTHHIGTGILGSHCAIYALGTSPGTVIRNNHVHHVFQAPAWRGAGEGIILDNGCCGILVENNVVHDAVAGGFGTNFNCFGNVIVNNIFAYGTEYQLTVYGDAPTGPPQPKGELFARNLVVWKDGPLIKEADWPTFTTLWDYNLYFREGGTPVQFMKYSFDEWKAKGLDRNSLIADPRFADPARRDFTLPPDSPALRLGFQPIDLRRVGPRAP
jgi:hypothetical protein